MRQNPILESNIVVISIHARIWLSANRTHGNYCAWHDTTRHETIGQDRHDSTRTHTTLPNDILYEYPSGTGTCICTRVSISMHCDVDCYFPGHSRFGTHTALVSWSPSHIRMARHVIRMSFRLVVKTGYSLQSPCHYTINLLVRFITDRWRLLRYIVLEIVSSAAPPTVPTP
jgi:hypothetical protein